MELPRRRPSDVYLPDGAMLAEMQALRGLTSAHDLRIGIVGAFDFRTRMLPYWYADKRMAPCSVRTLGDVLAASGFRHVRIVLQQWTPHFRPSMARLAGKPLDILLVSAMQVHAEEAYDVIRDAHRSGKSRPLIVAGGPKAIYEPTDFLELGPRRGIGADCVVTGEAFVLLQLLRIVLEYRCDGGSMLSAFNQAVRANALCGVPGLVYLSPDRPDENPVAVNTGVQRLLRNLDEMPMPDAGYRMIEPPHRGPGLRPAPLPIRKVHARSPIASVVTTQGCRFNCSFCPIPGANQRTWRHKSPERFAAEIKHIYETFKIRSFFGTDDNFFNRRDTVVDLMTALANTQTGGKPLGSKIAFYTEATQSDVYKNRDLLPLCRKAGLRGIWFGIEDLTGALVNKGQNVDQAGELFALLCELGIQPMAMLIHSDDQPLRSEPGSLSGLLNQARCLFRKGAVSYQCTYLGPAVGTRDFEPAARSRKIFQAVGGRTIPQAFQDGNHVVASGSPRPWERQINLLRAYASFYNPLNTARALLGIRRDAVSARRLLFQIVGQIGLVMTIPKMLRWAWRLKRGPIQPWDGVQTARIPMVDSLSGQEINWAIDRPPSPSLTCSSSQSDAMDNRYRGPDSRTAEDDVHVTCDILSGVFSKPCATADL
ncbi:MAG: radical SAM protein [Phycisphaerae bacterium]|nr:radical SAM protein [Phycisphaerae bacterium]